MPLTPRKHITALKPCTHGGFDYAEVKALGIDPVDIIDFSVSTNPYMPPPSLNEIITASPVMHYPDSQSTILRGKLAEKLGIAEDNIIAGNGTTELIRLIAQAYIPKESRPLIIEPAYGEYETACCISGARPVKYRTSEKNSFVPDIDKMIEIILNKKPCAVFICNPNNPTGRYLSKYDILKILDSAKNSLVVLDEAYVRFIEKSWDSINMIGADNLIILRSMTKDYGIPGLRLGYAAANREIIRYLNLVKPPWNVNAVAQQAGIHLLSQEEYLQETITKTRKAGHTLRDELTELGLEVLPSDTQYFLVKVANSTEFRRRLLLKSMMVRDCASFGLPQHIRLSPRTMSECERLVLAVKTILKESDSAVFGPVNRL